jgi:hypothetical protein
MSEALLRKAFGVSWHYRLVRTKFEWGGVQFFLDLKSEALVCPRCGLADEVIRKGRRCRRLQTVPIGLKPVHLLTEVARCYCRRCDVLFEVHPPLPGRTSVIPTSSKGLWSS